MRKKLESILLSYPDLGKRGFVVFDSVEKKKLTDIERRNILIEDQRRLWAAIDEVEYVVEWLGDVDKIKSINQRRSSYGLKHIVEKTAPSGYISNGAFIAGALIAGFDIEFHGINSKFNMSERSIKEKEKAIRGKSRLGDLYADKN